MGWTRFDERKSVILFPNSNVLTLIEEAHHVETAAVNGLWGETVETVTQLRARQNFIEAEWEAYAKTIGAYRK
jgi:hypothetical protein